MSWSESFLLALLGLEGAAAAVIIARGARASCRQLRQLRRDLAETERLLDEERAHWRELSKLLAENRDLVAVLQRRHDTSAREAEAMQRKLRSAVAAAKRNVLDATSERRRAERYKSQLDEAAALLAKR